MTLEPVSGTPGLWRHPQWQPGMAGVHALIIGISAYPHLEDGTAPAPDTYGLGQLLSSARTAARVFNWLRTDFHYPDLPVVWALLLRPCMHSDGCTRAVASSPPSAARPWRAGWPPRIR